MESIPPVQAHWDCTSAQNLAGSFPHTCRHLKLKITHAFILPLLLGVSKDKVQLYGVLAFYINWTKYNSILSGLVGSVHYINSWIPPVSTAREPSSCD